MVDKGELRRQRLQRERRSANLETLAFLRRNRGHELSPSKVSLLRKIAERLGSA